MQVKFEGMKEYAEYLKRTEPDKKKALDRIRKVYPKASESLTLIYINRHYKECLNLRRVKVKNERKKFMLKNKDMERKDLKDAVMKKFGISRGTFNAEYIVVFPDKKKSFKGKVKVKVEKENNYRIDNCLLCKKPFNSELDELGVPYKRFCPKCTVNRKQNYVKQEKTCKVMGSVI